MGNILIDIETDDGFLNDWDLCGYRAEMERPTSQHERSVSVRIWFYRIETEQMSGNLDVYVCHVARISSQAQRARG